MLKEIYIVRHGYRNDWENPGSLSPTELPHDPSLHTIGIQQAAETADYFKDKTVQAIFSSPFYRCLQTAKSTANALDMNIFIEYGIG